MAQNQSLRRIDRLDQLVSILRNRDHCQVAELASEFNISPRTLFRDLNLLRMRGYPIEAEPGRGGGIRLDPNWGLRHLSFSHQELIELLVSLAVMERLGPNMLTGSAKSIRHRLSHAFSQSQRARVRRFRDRILVGELASSAAVEGTPAPNAAINSKVVEGFFELRLLHITYTDWHGAESKRTIEPQYLLVAWPLWYVLAWDHLRGEARSFRIDRIRHARLSDGRFRTKPSSWFTQEIADLVSPL